MSTHRDFAQALLAPEAPSPTCTRDPRGGAAGVRFDVYRNNVTVSLIEAMEAAFPVVAQLVGKAFFTAMAREFVRGGLRARLFVAGGRRMGVALGFAPLDLGLQRRDRGRYLLHGHDARGADGLADDLEQFLGRSLQHDHVGDGLRLEFVKHG